jgi:hypothetical protein
MVTVRRSREGFELRTQEIILHRIEEHLCRAGWRLQLGEGLYDVSSEWHLDREIAGRLGGPSILENWKLVRGSEGTHWCLSRPGATCGPFYLLRAPEVFTTRGLLSALKRRRLI